MAFEFIQDKLLERKTNGLYRSQVSVKGQQGRSVEINGKTYLNFSSNDYLGLAAEPEISKAWQQGLDTYGSGSGGSFLVTGHSRAHSELEDKLKTWLETDAVALFSSGYSANQAVLKLLLDKHDLLIQDKLNHASLMEAGMLLAAPMKRFAHNDMTQLSRHLQHPAANKLVVSEGVFSMDGDMAPVTQIETLCRQSDAWFMLDDAHGLGVFGEQGKGSLDRAGLNTRDINVLMATFGKALGVGGAFVAGSQDVIDYLVNFSRPYIYTTGLPPSQAVAIAKAIDLTRAQQWRRDKLQELIALFQQQAELTQLNLLPSDSAIQPLIIGDSELALEVAGQLREQGVWVTAIRQPTVPAGSARLRITLTAAHSKQDVLTLTSALNKVLNG